MIVMFKMRPEGRKDGSQEKNKEGGHFRLKTHAYRM